MHNVISLTLSMIDWTIYVYDYDVMYSTSHNEEIEALVNSNMLS